MSNMSTSSDESVLDTAVASDQLTAELAVERERETIRESDDGDAYKQPSEQSGVLSD